MLEAKDLSKSFKTYKKKEGFLGSIQSLFSREYTTKTAVDSFDLSINKGEIIGLLGPNGAGKTTLMKMFTGIIVPTKGKLKIAGHHPQDRQNEFKKKIALVMGQKSQLWWDIPAMDSLLLIQKYYEISESQFKKRMELMGDLLGVNDLLNIHVRKLSLGERMKLELMASLLHDPEIIFLDEPTIGLDLVAQDNIRKFIKDYHKENKPTIILTSHYMADVAELCERLVLIIGGQKRFDGDLLEFQNILGTSKKVSFQFEEQQNTNSYFDQYNPIWEENHKSVTLEVPASDLNNTISKVLSDYQVSGVQTEKMPIEYVMKKLMDNPNLLNTHD